MQENEKREIYRKHYWSLFLDFIEVFQSLTYQEFPLPVLANFYQYLEPDIQEQMTLPGFAKHLTTKVLDDQQVQPAFQKWLGPLRIPLPAKPARGKILLNFDYLRFSPTNYTQYFSPEQTVIFARFRKHRFQNIPVHCIKDYMPEVTDHTNALDNHVNELAKKANNIFCSVKTHPVWNNSFFQKTLLERLPNMVNTIAAVNNYLEKEPIACVIVGTTEDLTSRALTLIAARKGIPSICLQHGLLGGPEAFIPVFSTKVAVYGPYERDWYLHKGLEENRIAVTGHPRYDDVFAPNHMPRADFQKKYGLDSAKKTILLATQPNYVSLWNKFIEILAQNSGIEIIIKPHPWETLRRTDNTQRSMDSYEAYAQKYKSIRLITAKGSNLYDILPNVDLVVCNYSTVGLEAALFNKPLFILSDIPIDYYHKLGIFTSTNPIELAGLVPDFFKTQGLQQLAHSKCEEFLEYAYPQKLAGVLLSKEIQKLT